MRLHPALRSQLRSFPVRRHPVEKQSMKTSPPCSPAPSSEWHPRCHSPPLSVHTLPVNATCACSRQWNPGARHPHGENPAGAALTGLRLQPRPAARCHTVVPIHTPFLLAVAASRRLVPLRVHCVPVAKQTLSLKWRATLPPIDPVTPSRLTRCPRPSLYPIRHLIAAYAMCLPAASARGSHQWRLAWILPSVPCSPGGCDLRMRYPSLETP